MPKRPRFSRWRRLPPVFRSGEHRPIGNENERDRIILYLPGRLLDLAEALAEKTGIPSLQDYCERLLGRSIENEAVQQKVSAFEARRGPLEGLKEIAEDPDYLAEWHERSGPNAISSSSAVPLAFVGPGPGAMSEAAPNRPRALAPPSAEERVLIDLALSDKEGPYADADPPIEDDVLEEPNIPALEPFHENDPPGPDFAEAEAHFIEPSEERPGPSVAPGPVGSLPGAGPRLSANVNWHALLDVLGRHVGAGTDDLAFLPRLRVGAAPPDAKVAELLEALERLEAAHEGAETIDRRVAHALHRLALESQVLLTDAWPGAFDDRTVAAIRAVQESVERILSGQDIRYYPGSE